jgi:REP element-mobilizing transposase RayT
MAHTYTNLLTHAMFSTKDREPLITPALHDDLLAYMGGILRELRGALREANARPEHVHLFLKKNGIAYDERYIWS